MNTASPSRPRMSAAIALLAGAAALASVTGSAAPQTPPKAATAEPQAVTVMFRVLLPDGRPFTDVRPEDVELRVGSRLRTLGSVVFVEPGKGQDPGSRPGVAAPFATNARPANLRDTIFVVDDESIGPSMGQPLQAAIRQFISHLAPQDRVGLVTIPRGGINVGLTTDRAEIESALAILGGRALRVESEADAACRTRLTLDAVMNVFRGAADSPPAAMILFSAGLSPPMVDDVTRMSNPVGLCEIRAKDYLEAQSVLLGSPLSLFVVQVPDPAISGAALSTSQTAGLEHLAGTGGNRMTRLVGDGTAAMARLAAETIAFYRATFVPDDSERNGQTHVLSVRVNRPDVDVRAPAGVVIEPPSRPKPAGKADTPRDMLRVAYVYRDLPLRASAFTSRESSADAARIVVLFEPDAPAVSLKAAAVGLFDEKGRLAVQATADKDALSRTPPTIAVVAKTGKYRLRVAATDAAGRTGTVDSALNAGLIGAGPLKLSSLVLGVAVDGRFEGRLQFYDEPTAVAYLEIYGVPKGELSAMVELSETEKGEAAVRGAMRMTGGPADDRHVALGGIPISTFPPGDIVVRAVVSLDGAPIGTVSRTLRKAER